MQSNIIDIPSFENYGVPVTSLDNSIQRQLIHEKARLPVRDWINHQSIKIPYCDPETLINYLESVFHSAEGLRVIYSEEMFQWQVEYGTRPIEETIDKFDYDLRQIIMYKKNLARLAAIRALEMNYVSEHLDDIDYSDIQPIPILTFNRWVSMSVSLYYLEKYDSIMISFENIEGDFTTFIATKFLVKDKFKNPEDFNLYTREFNWFKRKNYLMLLEGIESKENKNIDKCLFNEYLAREICVFL